MSSRHIIEAADGSRHIIEIDDTPQGSTQEQRAALRASFDKAASDRALADEYSGGKGVIANLGAGMDNVVQGAKQLFGFGRDGQTIHEDRLLKKQLGDSTLGGGALQTTGEIAATAPLAMGAGGAAAKVVGKALPGATQWATRMGSRIVNPGTVGRAAVEGAAGGALIETAGDESRAGNVALGAGLGAAIPAAGAVGAKLKNALSKSAAPNRAARVFEKQLGPDNMSQIADQLDAPSDLTLPLSTAAKSQNTALASLERGARSRSDWGFEHDRKVAEKAWETIKGSTRDADELATRKADLDAMMAESREFLGKIKKPKALKEASDALSEQVQVLRETPTARQYPEMTKALGQVEEMLTHPERSAADYSSQYWRLSKMLEGNLDDESRILVNNLRDAVGEAADIASDGQFSPLVGRFMAESEGVGVAQSAKNVRGAFVGPNGQPLTARAWGDTPEPSSHALRKTLANKGGAMDPADQAGLDKLSKELSQHELYQAKNAPGPAELDQFNPLSLVTGWHNPINYIPLLRGGANWALKGSRKATTEAADQAMQDPAVWQKMMENYALSKSPLTPQEYALRMRRQLLQLPGRAGVAELGEE